MSIYHYRAYGLFLRSDLVLPELEPAEEVEDEDVVEIILGIVPKRLAGEKRLAWWLSSSGDMLLINIPDVARFLIYRGQRITMQPEPGLPEGDLRTYLLGTGLGALLHQRGLLPLHVSALLSNIGAVAFTGKSGCGKSTAAATLSNDLNWPIIADDVAVLTINNGCVALQGGVRRLRLWSDSLKRLGKSTRGLVRDTYRAEKFVVYDTASFAPRQYDLKILYEIDPDAKEVECIAGSEAFSVVLNAIYRPTVAGCVHTRSRLHSFAATTAQQVQCIRGPRPKPDAILNLIS